jgi:hypothetical protein
MRLVEAPQVKSHVKSYEIYVRINFLKFCKMTNFLVFYFEGLTVGQKSNKKSEMIILESYDSYNGLIFRN